MQGSQDEPLVHLKLTHIKQGDQWILRTSWSHVLGDASAYAGFLSVFSRFYQQVQPLGPLPIFERRLLNEDHLDMSLVPMMKYISDAQSREVIQSLNNDQNIHEQINVGLTGTQLVR
ncbi:unnamed protein product, partial [Rotaria sp. Silwood2]